MVDSSPSPLDTPVWSSESRAACCCAPVHAVSCALVQPLAVTAPIPAVHVPGTSRSDSTQGRSSRMQGQETMDDSRTGVGSLSPGLRYNKSKAGRDFQGLLRRGLLSRCSGHRQGCLKDDARDRPETPEPISRRRLGVRVAMERNPGVFRDHVISVRHSSSAVDASHASHGRAPQ